MPNRGKSVPLSAFTSNRTRATGGGAKRLHMDQAAIRQLSLTGIWARGMRGFMRHRPTGAGDHEPAVVESPVQLRAAAQIEPIRMLVQAAAPQALVQIPGGNAIGGQGLQLQAAVPGAAGAGAAAPQPVPPSQLHVDIENAAQVLVHRAVPASALGLAGEALADREIHDFHQYVYLGEPELDLLPAGSDGSHALGEFLEAIRRALRDAVYQFVRRNLLLYNGDLYSTDGYHSDIAITEDELTPYHVTDADLDGLIELLYRLFLRFPAAELYEVYVRVPPVERPTVLVGFFEWLRQLFATHDWSGFLDHRSATTDAWIPAYAQIEVLLLSIDPDLPIDSTLDDSDTYSFSPFRSDRVMFGLQLVFRQEWTRLGNQQGPIVRTIPLGPKQTEKVSIKRVSVVRATRQVETLEATETSRESATTEKDSREIVEEAADSMNWNVEGTVSGSYGTVSASVTAGVGGESSSSSREAKSQINESVEKTASKVRNETKIIVTTARETTDEFLTTSEITNPNEEIAITYVFARMMRQYRIHTYLAEVNSVAFIPEPLPGPWEIDENWIRRYDWILAKALLDESFRDDLAAIINDPSEAVMADTDMTIFRNVATAGSTALAGLTDPNTTSGGTSTFAGRLPDVFSGGGALFASQLDKERAVGAKATRRQQRNARLFTHIRANILHYMRAIWSQEDPQQRMQRYRRIQASTQWDFVPDTGAFSAGMTAAWPGEFVPVEGSERAVNELINPAGPIGYAVNCAIFYLRNLPTTVSLNTALSALRAMYVRFAIAVATVPGAPRVIDAFVTWPHWQRVEYAITFDGAGAVSITNVDRGNVLTPAEIIVDTGGTRFEFEGMIVLFETPPAATAYTVAAMATGDLQDPELPMLQYWYPLPPTASEAQFFDAALGDIRRMLPDVAAVIGAGNWGALNAQSQEIVRRNYHRYLLRREHTRDFLLDSNNVMIDLEVGSTPALEEFKRLHRAVDVAKALQEVEKLRLDNARRQRRVEEGDYADPDIENQTIVEL